VAHPHPEQIAVSGLLSAIGGGCRKCLANSSRIAICWWRRLNVLCTGSERPTSRWRSGWTAGGRHMDGCGISASGVLGVLDRGDLACCCRLTAAIVSLSISR
jgi:hypothetical protein